MWIIIGKTKTNTSWLVRTMTTKQIECPVCHKVVARLPSGVFLYFNKKDAERAIRNELADCPSNIPCWRYLQGRRTVRIDKLIVVEYIPYNSRLTRDYSPSAGDEL